MKEKKAWLWIKKPSIGQPQTVQYHHYQQQLLFKILAMI